MRIKIKFKGTKEGVPFNNQYHVISFLHKCLGKNNHYHDRSSNYSLSTIQGGKKIKGENFLDMSSGCYITVSSLDAEFISAIINFLIINANTIELCYGMKYDGYDFRIDNFKNGWNHVGMLSPIFLKTTKNKSDIIHTLNDDDFEEELHKHIINKLSKVNSDLKLDKFKVKVRKSKRNRTRHIDIKQSINGKRVFNIANQCNLEIFANKKVMDTLYAIGIGSSTGIGFGSIFNIENNRQYLAK